MPRRGSVPKREVLPDHRYNSVEVTKLINGIMWDGKKALAEKIVYKAFDVIESKTNSNPYQYFIEALNNLKPLVETKARRVGGSNYQVPVEVSPARQQTLAIRWLVTFARKRSERNMFERLAAEIMDAHNQTGAAYKKREETHKMAESNKAFAHYRW